MHASSLTEKRFSRHFDTYEQQAVVQRSMAYELVQNTTAVCENQPLHILEIGCGTGLVTKELIRTCSIAHYCGNDIVAESQIHSRSLLKEIPSSNFSFITGDASQITQVPFVPNIIISGACFQWMRDLASLIANLHSFLPVGGILAFSSFGPENYTEIRQLSGFGLDYHTFDALKNMLSEQFEILVADEKLTKLYFSNPTDVLRHIRETGVNGLSPVRWTKKELLSFTDSYIRLFASAEGLPLTYHPIQIIAKKL